MLTKNDYLMIASLINRSQIQVSEAPSALKLLSKISETVGQIDANFLTNTPDSSPTSPLNNKQ